MNMWKFISYFSLYQFLVLLYKFLTKSDNKPQYIYLGPKLFPHIGHWETALWLASGSVFNACGEGCLPLVPRSTEVSDSTLQLLMLALLSFLISGIMICNKFLSVDITVTFKFSENCFKVYIYRYFINKIIELKEEKEKKMETKVVL